MGDKIEAKRTAKRLGIPVVPGSDGGSLGYGSCRVATEIGFSYPGKGCGPAAAGAA